MESRRFWIRGGVGLLALCWAAGVGFGGAARGEVRLPEDHVVLWAGRPQVIAFTLKHKAGDDQSLAVDVGAGAPVKALDKGRVVAGFRTGFVRVQALKPGKGVLRIGDAKVRVNVKPSPVADMIRAEDPRPRVVSPITGSVVWGKVAVGVEVFADAKESGTNPAAVRLGLPDGRKLKPIETTDAAAGPTRHLMFEVDTGAMKPGPLALKPRVAGRADLAGPTVWVDVVNPRQVGSLSRFEAEDTAADHRPKRYTDRPVRVKKDKAASGQAYVDNRRPRPAVALTVNAEAGGWYQMMLRAKGRVGGGALPSVGFYVDDERTPRTAGRLAGGGEMWQRLAVGTPVWLDKDRHVILPVYENNFRRRSLAIDRVELLRLNEKPRWPATASASPDDPALVAALDPSLARRSIGGEVRLTGRIGGQSISDRGDDPDDVPLATLRLNGRAVSRQRSTEPTFAMNPGWFHEGDNTVQLLARMPDGRATLSPKLTVRGASLADTRGGRTPPRRFERLTVADPAWDQATRSRLHRDRRGGRRFAAVLRRPNDAIEVRLPADLTGAYAVAVDVRTDHPDRGPDLEATLISRGGDHGRAIGKVSPRRYYRLISAGTTALRGGDQRLELTPIAPDPAGKAKAKWRGRLWVRAVELRQAPRAPDKAPPVVTMVYPKAGQAMYGADAVVLHVADQGALARVRLIVDGQPTDRIESAGDGWGTRVLPVVLRGLRPGRHTLAVGVRDKAGNTTRTRPRAVNVLGARPDHPTTYDQAVWLLDRFGFGPEPRELAAVLTMGADAYLRDRLTAGDDPAVVNTLAAAAAAYSNPSSGYHVEMRGIAQALACPNPVRTNFTLFIDNHFSTWMRKTRPEKEAHDFQRFVRLGVAPFPDLLMASATSPAMLYFLDQHRSYAKRINENYAREIMELHTVGVHGGYTQKDVTQFSYLLTGWRFTEKAPLAGQVPRRGASYFAFAPRVNDGSARTFFGVHYPKAAPKARYDRVRHALEVLAARPQTAHFICHKLVEHYGPANPPKGLVDDLAKVFFASGGDLREVLIAMAEDPRMRAHADQPRLAHPLAYAVRLCRAVGATPAGRVRRYLQGSGFALYDRETPDGYPQDDADYADSNAMLQRWRFGQAITGAVYAKVPRTMRKPDPSEDPATWRQRLVDLLAVRLTGHLLGDRSNAAALAVLTKTQSTGRDRINLIAKLITQLPEANLR